MVREKVYDCMSHCDGFYRVIRMLYNVIHNSKYATTHGTLTFNVCRVKHTQKGGCHCLVHL